MWSIRTFPPSETAVRRTVMDAAPAVMDAAPAVRRRCATAAMAGTVGYALVDVVLQLLPPHYSAVSDAESNLAVGPFGWIMNLNFLERAALTACAIASIRRTGPTSTVRATGTALLTAAGICSAVLAFFPTDIADPDAGAAATSFPGTVHLGAAGLGFLSAIAAFFVLTRWLRGSDEMRKVYPAALSLSLICATGLLALGLSIRYAPAVLGLAERLCLAGTLGWVFVVCGAIRRLP